MKFPVILVAEAALALCLAAPEAARAGQSCVPSRELADEPRTSEKEDSPAGRVSAPRAGLKELPREILEDQKFLWPRPFQLKRRDAPWAAVTLGATAGLIATDRSAGQELSESPPGGGYDFSRRVGEVGGPLTDLGIAGSFYLLGRWRGDERARRTGVTGLRAWAATAIVVEALKAVTQRPRPTKGGGRLRNHNADGEFFTGGNSFPSGHAAEAWALATVVAGEYSRHRWVPPAAYTLAGFVSVSRLTQRKHFPSDVFVGTVLGYLIARHASHAPARDRAGVRRRARLLPRAAALATSFLGEPD